MFVIWFLQIALVILLVSFVFFAESDNVKIRQDQLIYITIFISFFCFFAGLSLSLFFKKWNQDTWIGDMGRFEMERLIDRLEIAKRACDGKK